MTNFTQPTKLPHVCSEVDLSHNFKIRRIVVESDIQTVLLITQLPCSQNLTEVWVVSVLACKHVIICNGWNGLGFVFFPCLYRFSNECDDHAVTIVKPVPTIFQYLHFYLCQRTFHRQRKCRHFGVSSHRKRMLVMTVFPLPILALLCCRIRPTGMPRWRTGLMLLWRRFSIFLGIFSACLALFVLVILFFFFRKGLSV